MLMKTSHSALNSGVLMGIGEFNPRGEPCDGLASHPGGCRNTTSRIMLLKLEISASLIDLIGLYATSSITTKVSGQHRTCYP